MHTLKLIRPTQEYADQVMAYRQEMLDNGDSLDGCAALEDTNSYAEWADFEGRLRERYGEGYVPSDVYLAVRKSDDRLVGMIDFRRPLTEFLLRFGGNIGYSVRPSERGKGYAGEMLSLLLPKCSEAGENRVLLTCDADNEASRRTIIKNGGVLENRVECDAALSRCGMIQRYWITLQP